MFGFRLKPIFNTTPAASKTLKQSLGIEFNIIYYFEFNYLKLD